MTQYLQVKSHWDGKWYWVAFGPPAHLVEKQADASPMEDDVLMLMMLVLKQAEPLDELRILVLVSDT